MRTSLARAAAFRVVAFALCSGAGALFLGAQQATTPASRDALARALDAVRRSNTGLVLPQPAQFAFGDTTVASRITAAGPLAVANGTVHVRGTVNGDVVVYAGDIVVHDGGLIRGNAFAILGKVSLDGGRVDGEVRSLSGDLTSAPDVDEIARTASPAALMAHAFALASGWLAVLMIVGIGVLVFASPNLEAVSAALERDFGRALLAGIGAQLALFPVLALLILGLALTLLGVLLIPFAVVAYVLATAGLVTLGYLAIAGIAGAVVVSAPGEGDRARRAAALRGVLVGLALLMIPWFVSAGLEWSPVGSTIARTVAVAITWVACSAGLGAALISRGGVRRAPAPVAQRAMASAGWQTPTPVAGVTAARRPTPLATPGQK